MAILPDLADVRAWVNVPATLVSDPMLEGVIAAEAAVQARLCRVPDDPAVLPADLSQALLRRCARHIAARGVPLGMLGADTEFGPARLARWDAEVERLEGPSRKFVVG